MRKNLIVLFLFVLVASATAQNISGPSPVDVDDEETYIFYNGVVYMNDNWSTAGKGTILTKWRVGANYYATIRWTSSGTANLEFRDNTYVLRGSMSVTINVPIPAVPNTSFTITQSCGSTQVTRNSNPPSGVTWYWQTSASGTSTSIGSGASITRTTSGNLYLRARQGTTWSTTLQAVGSVSITNPLSAPSSSTDGDMISNSPVNVPVSVSSVSGATSYRWYLQVTGGTPIGGANTTSYSEPLSTSRTYYVETMNVNCPSTTRRSVTAHVYPEPVVEASNGGELMHNGVVTLSVNNYSYDSYSWRDPQGNTIPGATSSSFVTSQTGIFKVLVTKGSSSTFLSIGQNVSSENYTASYQILIPGITGENNVESLAIGSVMQTTQFVDGVGRPVQTVQREASPQGYDIVQPVEYDVMGREARKFLPYVGGGNGWIKKDLTTGTGTYNSSDHYQFYNQGSNTLAQDSKPFSQTVFEKNPLSRPLEQGSPGDSWQPDGNDSYTSMDRTVKLSYGSNAANEVRYWVYTAPAGSNPSKLVSTTFYAPNELSKVKTKDEQYHEVIEFKDKSGQIILKKVEAPNGEWAGTYYIYDDAGNLVMVLPPEGVKALAN